jgi:type I restriction enzyme S subunit
MSSEWQEHRLGDITRWVSGGTPSKQNPEYWGGSIPWISASSMKAKECAESDERITEEAVRSGARMCDPGTILLLVRGSELHKRIPIGVAAKKVAFNQDVKAITTCSEDLSGEYLYYLLKGSGDFLLNSVEFTGIGAGKLETPFLQDLVFPIPTRKEQKVITDFMIALDNKIELNRKTNETLEAMAKALFKSWFVDFDPVRAKAEGRPTGLPAEISDLLPDSFEDSELGEIPSGWKIKKIGDVISRLPVGKRFDQKTVSPKGSIPVLDQSASGIVGYHDEEAGVLAREDFPLFTFANHTCAMRYMTRPFSVIQNVFPLRGNGVDTAWLYQASQGRQEITEYKGHYPDFIEKQVVVPANGIDKIYGGDYERILIKCDFNLINSAFLASIRDALLPKLISGEIQIPDAEKMLEEVGI